MKSCTHRPADSLGRLSATLAFQRAREFHLALAWTGLVAAATAWSPVALANPRAMTTGVDVHLRPMFVGGFVTSGGLDEGPGVEFGAAYRMSQTVSFGANLSLQSSWSLTGLFRFAGTGPFTWTFEIGAGYGEATEGQIVTRAGSGPAFNVNLADRVLLSFGPMGAVEAWLLGSPAVRVTTGLDLRVTIPISMPPPPPEHRYARVVSTVRVQGSDDAPEVTPTPLYAQMLPSIRHVAVRAPSNCENARATATTGQSQGVGAEILHTTCGVEMAELERRLTRQGFVVTSWTTLSNTVDTQHITPTQAAQLLGAEVLFQVNSLERTRGNANRTFAWEQIYQRSDEYGSAGEALPLPERDRATIRSYVRDAELRVVGAGRLGATFDVNAISVATGQSVWFFRWNHLQPFNDEGRVTGLARQIGDGPWLPVQPRSQVVTATSSETISAHDAQRIDEVGAAADAQQALYNQLVREAIDRFVLTFSPNVVPPSPAEAPGDRAPRRPAEPEAPSSVIIAPTTPVVAPTPEEPPSRRRRRRR